MFEHFKPTTLLLRKRVKRFRYKDMQISTLSQVLKSIYKGEGRVKGFLYVDKRKVGSNIKISLRTRKRERLIGVLRIHYAFGNFDNRRALSVE